MGWLVFFLSLLIAFWLLWSWYKAQRHIPNKSLNEVLGKQEAFLQSSRKVIVNLDDCDVITGYDKIVDTGELSEYGLEFPLPGRAVFAGNLALALGPEEKPREDKNVFYCRIRYQTSVTGHARHFYSNPILKDNKTVLMFMLRQKKTTLYIDPLNPENYWLDTRFLDN